MTGFAYRHEKKNTSHIIIGRNGRKNWRVMGSMREVSSSVAATVLTTGPGVSANDKVKMPSIMSTRYCPS